MLTRITAYFNDGPGGPLDKACRSIFEARGGVSVGAGTMLSTGERDQSWDVPTEKAEDCKAALRRAGFRLVPTGDTGSFSGIPDETPPTN